MFLVMESCLVCGDEVVKGSQDLVWNNDQTAATRFFVRIPLEFHDEFNEFLSSDKLLQWWNTCEQCQSSIEESFRIYKQLEELVGTLRRKQDEFVSKLKHVVEGSNDKRQSPRRQTRKQSKIDEVTQIFQRQLTNRDWSTCTILNILSVSQLEGWTEVKEEMESDDEETYLCLPFTIKTEEDTGDCLTVDRIQSPESVSTGHESNANRNYAAHEDSLANLDEDNIQCTEESPGENDRSFQSSSKRNKKISGISKCKSPTTTTERHSDHDVPKQKDRPVSGKMNRDKSSDEDNIPKTNDNDSERESSPPPNRSRKRKRKSENRTESCILSLNLEEKLSRSVTTGKFHCPSCDYASVYNGPVRKHYIIYHIKQERKVKKKREKKNMVLPDLQKNPGTDKFPCPSCDYTHATKQYVRLHYERKHLNIIQQYDCSWPDCGRTFTNKDNFRGHMDKHKGTPRYKCSECPLAFYTTNPLVRHRQRDHEGGAENKHFVCEQCGEAFTNRDCLYNHKSQKHTRKEVTSCRVHKKKPEQVCEICGEKQRNLYYHMRSVHNKTIVPVSGKKVNAYMLCKLCGKSVLKQNMNNHMRNIHHDMSVSDKYTCSECHYTCKNKESLDLHLYSQHKIGSPIKPTFYSERKFACDVERCKRKFNCEYLYKAHMEEIHGPDKNKPGPFVCKYCGKRFFFKEKVEYHELTHENAETKPFSCDTCGKRFATRVNLRYHLVYTHKMKLENRRGIKRPTCEGTQVM